MPFRLAGPGACVAGVLLGVLSISCRDGARVPHQSGAPPSPVAQSAGVSKTSSPEPEALDRILEQAPHLNRQSAELLLSDARRRRVPIGDLGEGGLILASAGFGRLPEPQLRELGQIFDEVYAPMTADARSVVEAYLERLRRGDAAMSDGDRRARELLRDGISRLPQGSRLRLQTLFAAAIQEAFAARRQTARARRETPGSASASIPEAWNPSVHYRMSDSQDGAVRRSPSPPSADEEERRLRSKAEAYKSQLVGLEAAVKSAESELEWARKSYEAARQTPMTVHLDDPGSKARDDAQSRIQAAEENLRRARNAVVDLEREAQREGILPGYLR
jgi:hypothetical protein